VDALAVSEARFRGVVENLGEALLLVGLNGETLSINPRFTSLLGWRQEDLEGRNALKLLMPDADRYSLLLGHEGLTQDGRAIEVRLKRRDGSLVWTEIHASPMHGPDGELVGTLAAILDITARHKAAEELEETNKRLVDASHAAGMAQVATGVLHNVGNVLNSVNLTASLSLQKLRESKVANLTKAADLITSKNGDLASWLTTDPQGQKLPGYLAKLATRLTKENTDLISDLDQLAKNVEHIKEIVSVQQNYAQVSGLVETLPASRLVEDAIRMNTAKFVRHGIEIVCNFAPVPPVKVDKHKTLQILVNLIRNAKHALEEARMDDRKVTIKIAQEKDGFVNVSVSDNGIGIPPENLTRIFQHGFTTKKNGHGFGLHSGALAAREMGGSLTVQSGGSGTGATFTLALPTAATHATA
jgi:PAS domain S-box-containing protein